MNIKRFVVALLLVFAISGVAYPWGSAGGDGSRYGQVQETAVFFNNSGSTIVSGLVMVLDRTGSGVTADTTLGIYVTTTTVADSSGVVGIVKCDADNCSYIDQGPVVIITKGPANAHALDSSDAIVTDTLVGTSTRAGFIGSFGDNQGVGIGTVGYALEAGDGTDTGQLWIWVNPQ